MKNGRRKKIGLVLVGGGARGFAHIGVLRKLEKASVHIDYIVGVSMGGVVGALYSYHRNADKVEEIIKNYIGSEKYKNTKIPTIDRDEPSDDFWGQFARKIKQQIVINIAAYKDSLTSGDEIAEAVNMLLPDVKDFTDLKIPFACVASDLVTGEEVLFDKGDLHFALRASASIPGYLPPIRHENMVLADGAVANNIPANLMREVYRPDLVVISDVSQKVLPQTEFESVYDVIVRSINITHNKYRKQLLNYGDIIINCRVGSYPWYAFNEIDKIIKKGEEAADNKLDEILMRSSKKISLWKTVTRFVIGG